MRKFRLILLSCSFLLLWACSGRGDPAEMASPADPANVPDLIGTYVVNGFDPLGMEYGGHLTITASDVSGNYQLQWIITGGIQNGQGVLKGNQLFVDWEMIESSTGHSQGTAVYTVTQAGQLDGIRFVDGLEGEGIEQAYPNQ